ncbi:hypothetical protein LXL04_037937 [Taraxacum kok-saghyz]
MGELPPPSQLHPSQPPSLRQPISAVSDHLRRELEESDDDRDLPLPDDRDLPLPDATADGTVHLRRELEESDDNHHEYDVVESLNQGNRDRQGSDDENEEGEERQRQRRHLLRKPPPRPRLIRRPSWQDSRLGSEAGGLTRGGRRRQTSRCR